MQILAHSENFPLFVLSLSYKKHAEKCNFSKIKPCLVTSTLIHVKTSLIGLHIGKCISCITETGFP